MTHVDDREPDDSETELLNPEELIEAIDDPQARATVEALLADVRYLRGLETREEWAITARHDVEPSASMPLICKTPEALDSALKVSGGVAWARQVTVHPWQPVSDKSPF